MARAVAPVWVAPKSDPMASWASSSTPKAAVSSRPPVACPPGVGTWRPDGWSANAVPKTASSTAAVTRPPEGEIATAATPTTAGPTANEASSAAPS